MTKVVCLYPDCKNLCGNNGERCPHEDQLTESRNARMQGLRGAPGEDDGVHGRALGMGEKPYRVA